MLILTDAIVVFMFKLTNILLMLSLNMSKPKSFLVSLTKGKKKENTWKMFE